MNRPTKSLIAERARLEDKLKIANMRVLDLENAIARVDAALDAMSPDRKDAR